MPLSAFGPIAYFYRQPVLLIPEIIAVFLYAIVIRKPYAPVAPNRSVLMRSGA